jgi:3-dehydroquinate synthase
MRTLTVDLKDKSYNIYIGADLIKDITNIIDKKISKKVFIVTDEIVQKLYLDKVINGLKGRDVSCAVIKKGEDSKSLDTLSYIYSQMLESRCDRETTLISLGGGVVGDIAGFAAATYMRGINYIQIPTTLLSQVDSSVGGKVAANFEGVKNVIGAFYQPMAVIIDINTLATLEKREFYSGLGEVAKYGLIKNYSFLEWIDRNFNNILELKNDLLIKTIYNSVCIKKYIVEQDEREKGIRRILNFGHTIGHGIEALQGLCKYTHGEAVVLGMMYESKIAKKMGLIDTDYYKGILEVLSKIIQPVSFNEKEILHILKVMKHDKKFQQGKSVFVLPIGKGEVEVFKGIEEDLIINSLKGGI